MHYNEVISHVNVYGLNEAVKGAKYPMATDLESLNDDITKTTIALATSRQGEGHDNFLNGILITFDLTLSNKAWVEAQRYHFLDFISSQSTMHRITRFDLDKSYMPYVDPRMIAIMKEKVAEYNELHAKSANDPSLKQKYLEILYSNPCGFRITAKMTTNYRQLKTIYHQRRHHRLPEWQAICDWIETLPHSEFIIGIKK
ncbi:hypothetical protein EII25_05425 [Erysipelotrichaceae bacterium OH741_COT-311]|nr:hypothetical protein [Erysipelotrichaceae bacterium]RRC91878.1 hypothetical protein EII25_05425 [Erysipelotrichaceae bacterium OH741_COT-311]